MAVILHCKTLLGLPLHVLRLLTFLIFFSTTAVFAQNTLHFLIKDSLTNEPLPGATALLEGTTNGAASDAHGIIIQQNIPEGKVRITFSLLGYNKKTIELASSASTTTILLSQ